MQDTLILCSDGLNGLKESIKTAYPETEHQRCIVHMVRNTLKYVANKDMKAFAKDLKTIYTAPDEKSALEQLDAVTQKWSPSYPSAMKCWYLATFEATKKWTMSIRNWGKVRGELEIMYPGRLPE